MKFRVVDRPDPGAGSAVPGCEVVDDVPDGWFTINLGEAGEWGSGGTPKRGTSGYYGGPIPWLKIGDLNDGIVRSSEESITKVALQESSAKLVPAGAVLIAMYGSIGKMGLNAIECATNQAIAYCITTPGLTDARYLFWYLRSARERLISQGKGGTQQNISQTVLRTFPFPLPPLAEQRRIADAVEVLLARVEAARARLDRAPAILKRFRQAVLAAACSGRLTEDWRESAASTTNPDRLLNGLRGARRELLMANDDRPSRRYRDPLAATTIASSKIPQTWTWATVDEAALMVTDGDHNPPKRVAAGVPHLTAKNVKNWSLSSAGCTFVSETDFQRTRRRYEPRPGDVIVTCVGTIGETAIVPKGYRFSADRNLAAIRPVPGWVRSEFIQLVLNAPPWADLVKNASGASAQPHLYLGDLRALSMPLPSPAEQDEIVRRVAALFSLADAIERRVAAARNQAEALPQAILARAFSGRLVPTEAELARREGRTYEPASVLLERIRRERAAQPATKKTRRRAPD